MAQTFQNVFQNKTKFNFNIKSDVLKCTSEQNQFYFNIKSEFHGSHKPTFSILIMNSSFKESNESVKLEQNWNKIKDENFLEQDENRENHV